MAEPVGILPIDGTYIFTMSATLAPPTPGFRPRLALPKHLGWGFYVVALLLLLASASLAYYWFIYRPAHTVAVSTLQTAAVRQGDLVLSAVGTGTLTAPEEQLGFSAASEMTVTGVHVKAGDLVQAGDLLAEVNSRQVQSDYDAARRAYTDLTSATGVASAQRAIADAQAALDSAEVST